VLTGRMLQHVVDVDGVHSVDFLSGDDAYKKDWMSARRCRTDAILAPRFGWTRFKHALLAVHENFK
jgi:CelD/BcsL family acetyltransferase involved in cellulose biosynthesis